MKVNSNITLFVVCIILILTTLTSCNKWLNVKPENEQSNSEFWSSKEEVDAVVMGAYVKMRASIERLVIWGELRADVMAIGPDKVGDDNFTMIKDLEIRASNPLTKWADFYTTIARCNSVIAFAPSVLSRDDTFTQKACDAYVAEMIWLRSLCYFYLVRTFRDVPYITDPFLDDSKEFVAPKIDGEKILEYIVADLNAYMQKLPYAYKPGSWENKGRATTCACYALLADIYLWQGKYSQTLEMCQNVQNSGLFTLLSTNNWYTLYYPGNSNESIFELQWSNEYGQKNDLFAWFHNNTNAQRYAISQSAIDKYNEYPNEVDIRGLNGSYQADGKVWKYAGTAVGAGNMRDADKRDANWIIYRFSDILLMRAEALVMSETEKNLDAAYGIVKAIRERAGYTVHPDQPSNEQDALNLVMDERMREFSFEGKRWYDLVRMAIRDNFRYKNTLIQVLLTNVAPKDRPLYEAKLQNPYGYYLPIFDEDIDASRGVLIQNPYYL